MLYCGDKVARGVLRFLLEQGQGHDGAGYVGPVVIRSSLVLLAADDSLWSENTVLYS